MKVGILGAGIAGLAVAWFLGESVDFAIHEASNVAGGLARSFKWHGFDCDIGPHRFFTEDKDLVRQMQALVPLRHLERRSRIRLRGRWLRDPVNIFEVLFKFMPVESARILWRYLRRPHRSEDSFEDLVLNKYGSGLNELFFKPYSEKLFGIPSSEISASWGRRKIRISGFRDLIHRDPRLYFRSFYYPAANGYGAIADRLYADVREHVHFQSRVAAVRRLETGGYECRFEGPARSSTARFDVVVSTLPMPEFAALLGADIRLQFRPMTLLYLLVGLDTVSNYQWTYFADRHVIVNRVAEFKHFGRDLPSSKTVLCCEVTDTHRFSVDRVIEDLSRTGFLPSRTPILDTKIIRLPHAYPIYDRAYDEQLALAQQLFKQHPRIYHIGRQAQFVHKDVDEIFEQAKELVAIMRREALPSATLSLS